MKISEYERVEKVDEFDLFLLEKIAGTKSVRLDDIYWSMMDSMSVENRRHVWRGKNLGAEFTGQQRAAVKDGSFRGLFLGDYWENPEIIDINDIPIRWRIVDFDYGYSTERTVDGTKQVCTTHHVLIMPDQSLNDSGVAINKATDNMKAYAGSQIRIGLGSADTYGIVEKVRNMFGTRISGSTRVTTYYEFLPLNVTSDGFQNTFVHDSLGIELPSLGCLFGQGNAQYNQNSGSIIGNPSLYYIKQYAAFKINPYVLDHSNGYYWLRDVVGVSGGNAVYAVMTPIGRLDIMSGTSANSRIRPSMAINGED